MEYAEKWVRNLNLRENTWVVDDHLDINDKLAMHEAARAKDAELIQRLVDALNRLVYLELCNSEGLSSGAPTSMDWQQAFDKAQQQIDAAAAAGFKPSDQS